MATTSTQSAGYDIVPLKYSKYYHWKGNQNPYPENQGILSVEADNLAFDTMQADPKKADLDPLSHEASARVASRYKNYGNLAMLPEQAAEFNYNLDTYKKEDTKALNLLKNYHSKFTESLAARDISEGQAWNNAISTIDTEASKIRPGAMGGGMKLIPVRVTKGNSVEATYMLPATVADALAKEKGIYTTQTDEGFNVDVRAKGGKIIGQELHDAFREAEQKTAKAIQQGKSAAAAAAASAAAAQREAFKTVQYGALVNAINESRTQRNIAVEGFDQEFSMGLERYKAIGNEWGKYLNGLHSEQRTKRSETNKGIGQLAKSGILNYGVKRG